VDAKQKIIDEIINPNDEQFKKIEDIFEEIVKAKLYRIEQKEDGNCYFVTEEVDEMEVSQLISNWRCTRVFKGIPSLFKDTPSHTIKTYDDLRMFQEKLKKILLSAFDFMGDKFLETPVFPAFKENFEIIKLSLQDVENRIVDYKKSSQNDHSILFKKYQQHVQEMNTIIDQLNHDNLVVFGPKRPQLFWNKDTAAEGIKVKDGGLTASKQNSNCDYSVVASNVGWASGFHKWYIKSNMVGCYDTIGVADESSFKTKKPLLAGLGTYPGGHRDRDKEGIKFTQSTCVDGTIIKVILDLKAFELKMSVVGEFYFQNKEEYTVNLADFFEKGTKLFPAMTLCNNAIYSIVKPNWKPLQKLYVEFCCLEWRELNILWYQLKDIRFAIFSKLVYLVKIEYKK